MLHSNSVLRNLISYECHKNLDIHAFGLINDIDIADTADPKELFENGHRVKYFLDKEIQTAEKVSFHPCDNTASVVLTRDMFMKFLSIWGGEVEWLEIN